MKRLLNQKAIAKRFRNRIMYMSNFLFRLPNVKILNKMRIFYAKSKQKDKY